MKIGILCAGDEELAPFLISICRCHQIRSYNRSQFLMTLRICFRIATKPPNYTGVTNLRSMKFCLQNMQFFSYLVVAEKTFFLLKRTGSKQYLMQIPGIIFCL